MAECKHHSGYDCGDLPMPHSVVPENKLPKPKRRNAPEWRLARMLSILCDEPGDNPDNPAPIRIEQARQLLPQWSSAQGSLLGALGEAVAIKLGFCVRCPEPLSEEPCKVCGLAVDTVRWL